MTISQTEIINHSHYYGTLRNCLGDEEVFASYIIKGEPVILRDLPMTAVCISAITGAELLRGVARKPEAKSLPFAVKEFLLRVKILS